MRSLILRCSLSFLLLVLAAAGALAQSAPIIGSGPVLLLPSVPTPAPGELFTVEVRIDLGTVQGTGPGGTVAGVLSGFRVPIAFDRTRLELVSVVPGSDGRFAAAGLNASELTTANAAGRVTLVNEQTDTVAPIGVISVAVLGFQGLRTGPADVIPEEATTSLASAVQTSGLTLYGPAAIPPRGVPNGVVVQFPPALTLKLEAGPTPVLTQGQLAYTIRCSNTGGALARQVVVTDQIPAGATFVSASLGGQLVGGTVTWNVGDLAPAAFVELTLVVSVTAVSGTTIVNDTLTAEATEVSTTAGPILQTPVVSPAPGLGPGTILAATSYGTGIGIIWNITSGTREYFATVPGSWIGPMVVAPNGHVYVAVDRNRGSVYDITSGGDLRAATPFAQFLFPGKAHMTGLAADESSNLYVVNGAGLQPIAKITPSGQVSFLLKFNSTAQFTLTNAFGAVFRRVSDSDSRLHVSEGATGLVQSYRLENRAISSQATGFTKRADHFSGQLGTTPSNQLYVLWSNPHGRGLFDITTSVGSNATADPIVHVLFRFNANQIAFDEAHNAYLAGDGGGKVYWSRFSSSGYGPIETFASGLGDCESLAIYPTPVRPILDLAKIASPDPVGSGSQLTYTVQFGNRGGAAGTSAILSDQVPAGTTFVSASDGGTLAGGTVTWNLGTLIPREVGSRQLTVRVGAGAGGSVTNGSYSLRAAEITDPIAGPPVTTLVVVPPQLSITKAAGVSPVTSGGYLNYVLSYANTGRSAAANTIIEDTLPPGTRFVSQSPVNLAPVAGVVRWSLGALEAGSSGTVFLTVRVTATSGSVTNANYSIRGNGVLPVPGPPVTTAIEPASSLTVTITGAPSPVVPDTQINCRLSYVNGGATAATNVILRMPLPAGTEVISIRDGGTFTGGLLEWVVPELAAGGSGTARFSLRAKAAPNTFIVLTDYRILRTGETPTYGPALLIPVQPVASGYGVGTILTGIGFPDYSTTVWDATKEGPGALFAKVRVGQYASLAVAPNGHAYLSSSYRDAIYDLTPGGDLMEATPFVSGLKAFESTADFRAPGLAADDAGNLYLSVTTGTANIIKVTPEGDWEYLTDATGRPIRIFNAWGAAIKDNILYVSEANPPLPATSGRVKAIDLATRAITIQADGFLKTGGTVFSGQLAVDPDGRLFVKWGTPGSPPKPNRFYDITNPASKIEVQNFDPNHLHINQFAFGPKLNPAYSYYPAYVSGGSDDKVYRLVPTATGYDTNTIDHAIDVGDVESLTLAYPLLRVVGSASANPVETGAILTYTLSYTNAGPQVLDAALRTAIPEGTLFESASPGSTFVDGIVSWNLGTLAQGASGTQSFRVLVTAPDRTEILHTDYFIRAKDVLDVRGSRVTVMARGPLQPMIISAAADPEPVLRGQLLTYTLSYENENLEGASNVVVTNAIPAGTELVSIADGGTQAGGVITWNVGTVDAEAHGSVSFVVRVTASGSVTNSTYTITSTTLPPGSGPALTTLVLEPPVILTLSLAASAGTITTQETLTYTLSYANTGATTATSVTLQNPIPAGTAFLSAGGGGTVTGSAVVWTLGTLPPGATGSVAWAARVTAPGGATVTNGGASIMSTTASATANTVVTLVQAIPPSDPLGITLAADRNPVVSGTVLTYVVTITNLSEEDATAVVVNAPVPDGAAFLQATGGGTLAGGSVEWQLGDLPAAATSTLYYQVLVTAPAGETLVISGATVAAEARPLGTSGSLSIPVVSEPAVVFLSIVAAPSPVVTGSTLTYTLSFINAGPGSVGTAMLENPLPEGTSFVSAGNGGTLAGGVVTWSLGTLPSGAQGGVTFVVQADAPGGATLVNSGSLLRDASGTLGTLATGPIVLTDVVFTAPIFSGSVATDKPLYEMFDTIEQTGTVTYTDGGDGIAAGLIAELATLSASGTVVATSTTVLPELPRGATESVRYDLPTEEIGRGTFSLVFTVQNAAGEPLVSASTTFTVEIADGLDVAGTIAPNNSPVAQGIDLSVHVALENSGSTSYANFPLEVSLVDPDTFILIKSVALGLPVASGATASSDVLLGTANLLPREYPLWLTTTLGGGRLLAQSVATVLPPTITLSPASQIVTAGATGTLSLTISAAQSADTTIVLSSSNAAIASVPASVMLLAGTTTQPFAVAGLAVGGPVTITATLPASLGGGSASAVVSVALAGTLAVSTPVMQGNDIQFGVTLTNAGSTSVTDQPFAIEIRDPLSGTTAATVPFTASVPAGGSSSTTLTYSSATLAIQGYTAHLFFLGLAEPALLASGAFEVVDAPPLECVAEIAGPPRLILWVNCSPGNSGNPCTPVTPPFLTQTLTTAGIPYRIVGDEYAFLAEVRTGAYDAAVIYQPSPAEPKIAKEYLEDIRAGLGLVFVNNAPNAMPKLAPALQTSSLGVLHAPTSIDLLATPFTQPGTLSFNGDGVRIRLEGALAAGILTGTTDPAISYASLAAGRTVFIPYDTEQTPTTGVADLLLAAIGYVARPPGASFPGFDARQVVPLHFEVTTPAGADAAITLAVTLPAGVSVVDAVPSLSIASPPTWNVLLPGDTTADFYLWVRLPESIGTYTVSVAVGFQNQTPLCTETLALEVVADRSVLANALAADLAALRAQAAKQQDLNRIDHAIAELAAIQAVADPNAAGVLEILERMLNITADLSEVSFDTTQARADADRFLVYWQSRAGI